ncbi:ANTAR domain-containing protein, partial [Streptomyces xanthophaeus]|uniref:ANTAR domain-containing protein n=1 Tax=Streptomyces xanthophaeus TaxID=67385 RepID=UPI003658049A
MKGDAAPAGEGAAPEVLALAKVVARLRSEIAVLEDVAATTAVVERAKGVLMARSAVSAEAAYEMLVTRADGRGRTLLEECWLVLGQVGSRHRRMHGPEPAPARATPRGGRTEPAAGDGPGGGGAAVSPG